MSSLGKLPISFGLFVNLNVLLFQMKRPSISRSKGTSYLTCTKVGSGYEYDWMARIQGDLRIHLRTGGKVKNNRKGLASVLVLALIIALHCCQLLTGIYFPSS